MNNIDVFAISMLAVAFTSMGMVAFLFFNMARNARMRDPELEDLMEEALAADSKPESPAGSRPPPPREAWERDGDWWRTGK